MQIIQVKVAFGFTKNMGNYESLRADCTLEATINPELDDVYEELERLREDAREQVRKELARVDDRFVSSEMTNG